MVAFCSIFRRINDSVLDFRKLSRHVSKDIDRPSNSLIDVAFAANRVFTLFMHFSASGTVKFNSSLEGKRSNRSANNSKVVTFLKGAPK